MIPYTAFESISLGFFKIHVWGIFAALAFLAGIFFASREAKRRNLDPDVIFDAAPWIILGSILGARLVFLVENPSSIKSFIDIIGIWKGGLAFHGGFLGAVIVFIAYVKHKKLSLWKYADAIAPGIVIGHVIGRIGCYLSDMHVGKEADLPWSIFQQGALRHPVILYEIAALLVIFSLVYFVSRNKISKSFDGFVFAFYVAAYSVARFILEFFRTDPTYFGFSAAQYIVAVLFVVSAGFIVLKKSS